MGPIDPGIAAFLQALAAEPEVAPDQALVQSVRAAYVRQIAASDIAAGAAVEVQDTEFEGRGGRLEVRTYTPLDAAPRGPGLVYFHGGGFVLGDLDTHDAHCRRLCAGAAIRIIAVAYRLAPEAPFPAAHDDALDAVRWVFAHAEALGLDRRRIGVGGDSAGGNLAASVALDLKDEPSARPAFQLLLYPVTWPDVETASRRDLDGPVLTKSALAWFEAMLGAEGHPEQARARLGGRDLVSAPPALIVTAEHDPLKDEGCGYAARLIGAGVSVLSMTQPGLVHDFFLMTGLSPAVRAAVDSTTAALRAAMPA